MIPTAAGPCELDLFVGLTAGSAEMSNNGRFKPIKYEIYADAAG